jgi:large subunit ribosomal protein L22
VAEPQPEKRKRRKKTEEAEVAAEAKDAKEAKEVEEAEDDQSPDPSPQTPEAEGSDAEEAPAEDKPKRRRGSAETTARAKKETVPAPRDEAGQVEVRARAKYVRSAPRKARLVMQHIRGKSVADARAILDHTPRAVSRDVLKLLNSAVANAENNYELAADELKVSHAYADEGPTIKRWRPRAYGRATRINKRTSHMTILLTTTTAAEPAQPAKRREGK